ncbi:MAG: phosphate signaling complex protein PhoU [Planctomycetes bacterium]|nr:phosphate signaling complex protein PhoU [Planctomycetota bacterium]
MVVAAAPVLEYPLPTPEIELMTRHFLHALEGLSRDVLAMGGAVEATVARAVRAFLDRDVRAAKAVVDGDREINLFELRIDEECLKMLALYQPTARDLRFVTATMKIINDLERVGDLAVNIAERAQVLAELPPRETPAAFVEMADRARSMLTGSLDALVRYDTARAQEVLKMDAAVDRLVASIFDELEVDMAQHADRIRPDLQILSASKNVERIADHATNVAEDVVYMVEGTIIRHRY